jgi:hypothetical protein
MSCNRICFLSRDALREGHYKLSDEEFAGAVEECTLNPEAFNHEAHLRLAWVLIRRHGLSKATELLCCQIERFDRVYGNGRKFDRELTETAARLIHRYQNRSNSETFNEFLRTNPLMLLNFRELLSATRQK